MKWPTAQLGSVTKIVSGSTPKSGNPAFWGGSIPWATPTDLSGLATKELASTGRQITEAGLASCSANMLPAQSVLFSSRAPIGLVAINKQPLCTNQGFKSFVPDSSRLSPDFLFWWLKGNRPALEHLGRGATFKEVSKSIIEKVEIPLPPLAEQKRIAAILDAADDLRTKRREALAQLDALLQSTFLTLFGDPITNPKGWEMKNLKEISTHIMSGNTPKGGKEVYVEKGVLFFRSQNVWKNRLDLDDIAYLDEKTHLSMKKSSLKNRDILITKTGRVNTENSSLGRAAIFLGADNSANINGHVYLVRLKEKNIHRFVLFILTTNQYREYIRRACVGGIDKRQINKEHLEDFPIIFPPLPLQQKFATIVESVERQKAAQRAHLAELDALFAALQHRAFRGEL